MESLISMQPAIRFGKPCVTGTRISVSDILQWLASNRTIEDILHDFPELNKKQIDAALQFAANRELFTKMISA